MYLALQSCTPLQLVLLFEKKSLVCICFVSETRVPCGALERWVGDEPKLPGGSPACSKALPELGDFRCAPSPPVRSSDRLLFLHPLPPALLSATTLQSARGVTTLHVPRAVFSAVEGQRWGSPMAQPEMCIQSLPRSPVGCSCLQNHQLELFSLLFLDLISVNFSKGSSLLFCQMSWITASEQLSHEKHK